MSELKTKLNDASVEDFLNAVPEDMKRKDGFELLKLFTEVTGETAKMWGSSIVGFGQYHYKSERSSQEGDWPLTGFSPRKAALTLYLGLNVDEYADQLASLGKHKTGKGCLYINKLADIDLAVLRKLIDTAHHDMKKRNT
ncbi:DUF1801 domain-containing protein [Candidatus Saccharibacteria bacterium]|nr:MAG: DUF1801 domain-containing protein [Candidatus Saccharibacteria bacterium]